MNYRIKTGIIGATGMVGQTFIKLLENHPWFEVTYLAASEASAGKTYSQAVQGRWHMSSEIPSYAKNLVVEDAANVDKAVGKCSLIFSAVSLSKDEVRKMEALYASKGFAVVSANSAYRMDADVPMLIPEINHEHVNIIPVQQKNHGWDKGFITVKPNCSIQSYMIPLHALQVRGYKIKRIILTTLQALSGAGYPGPSAFDLVDNIVPLIKGEEEKSELEPQKIFGIIQNNQIVNDTSFSISAHCNRVPVIDGHTACVSVEFDGKKPTEAEIMDCWNNYHSVARDLGLPSAPERTIIYKEEIDRPQPRKDRDSGKGMTITVGRLRPCNVFDFRFVGLSHNTVRGAAGGAILMAELVVAKGFVK
ncbi:MAG TPA: aspartate-semialdehyde dehydrogenase [Bacteroidales bacterium]